MHQVGHNFISHYAKNLNPRNTGISTIIQISRAQKIAANHQAQTKLKES